VINGGPFSILGSLFTSAADKKTLADKFDTLVQKYFAANFGLAGTNYLNPLGTDTRWGVQLVTLSEKNHSIDDKILQLARKIVDKYDETKSSLFSLSAKKENEISFRLHRFIGALEFIRIYLDRLTNPSPRGKIIEDVLDGANTKFLFSTKFLRDVIKEISKISKEHDSIILVCLKLIGKVAHSKKKTPIFMDSLFKFVRLVVSKHSDRGVFASAKTVLKQIEDIQITNLDEAEIEINKIVAAALKEIKPQTNHAKSILKALQRPFILN